MSLDDGWTRIRTYLGWVFGAFGLVLAWLSGFDLVEKFVHGQDKLSVCANVYVAVTAVLAVSLTAYRQYITIRKEKYANISSNMHSIFHNVRNLHTLIDKKEPSGGTEEQYQDFIEECKSIFTIVLDQLCAVFISLTSTHCRACIKVVYKIDSDAYVYTLTRDQNSKSKCYQIDNKRLKDNHDPLEQNLKFAELFSEANQNWHFICNDLTSLAGFHSTSVTAYQPGYATSTPLRRSPWRSSNEWPLPYRSTIACVIGQGPFARCDGLRTNVAGFLTVDSESRGVFEDRWDVQIMFSVADAIYPILIRYLDLQNRATESMSHNSATKFDYEEASEG